MPQIKNNSKKSIKHYTADQISDKYNKLSLNKKNEILYEAIDVMQQYNGRSRFDCIAIAMGYRNEEGRHDTYYKMSD